MSSADFFLKNYFMAGFCEEEIAEEIFCSIFRFDAWPGIWIWGLRLISQHITYYTMATTSILKFWGPFEILQAHDWHWDHGLYLQQVDSLRKEDARMARISGHGWVEDTLQGCWNTKEACPLRLLESWGVIALWVSTLGTFLWGSLRMISIEAEGTRRRKRWFFIY